MTSQATACVLLCASNAFAAWNRHVYGSSVSLTDSPAPHALAYFMKDPCARPSDPLVKFLDCDAPGRSVADPYITEIGKIQKLTIHDVFYPLTTDPPKGFHMRSVLVQTAPDQYRELDVFIDIYIGLGPSFPSQIANLVGERLLIARWHDGGNNNHVYENLYMFRPSGLETPDFKAVNDAIQKLMPANMSVRTYANDYASMSCDVVTYRNDLNVPPVDVKEHGRITVTYRLVNGRAIVKSAKYEALQ